MAQEFADVTIDDREVLAMLTEKISKLDNPKPMLTVAGRYIRALTAKMFKGKRPDVGGVRGEKWPKPKLKTIQQKKAMGVSAARRPLVRTAKLRKSLFASGSLKVRKKGLEYGTDVTNEKGFPYPAIHQIGSPKTNLPQRRWLFLTKDELLQIAEIAKDYIEGLMKSPKEYAK